MEERERIYFERYDQEVCFGDRDTFTSKLRTVLPVTICGQKTVIRVYIVPQEIPLLLAMDNIRRLNIVIDYGNNQIRICSRHPDMILTEFGHSLLSILEETEPLERDTPANQEKQLLKSCSSEEESVTETTIGDNPKLQKKKKRKKNKKKKRSGNTKSQADTCSSSKIQAELSADSRTVIPSSHQMDRGVT
jgi:hypothetical protein